MKQLRYKNKPIGSISSLANALGFPIDELKAIADNSGQYYLANDPIVKSDGKFRQTYTVKEPLNRIQKKILQRIIASVDFPEYLQGAIRDPDSRRDYVRDANLHSGSEVILKLDISSFFSSTGAILVNKMWKYFFRFPQDVADLLTRLTVLGDFLPEGASTSAAIANLVFWDREPELESELRTRGYQYSRYIDDVTVSSASRVGKEELERITTQIYGMFIRARLKPNRAKRKVQSKGGRMEVHQLNLNSGKPTISKRERARIRAAVKALEELARFATSWDEIRAAFESVNGRVRLMERFHPRQAQQYLNTLKSIQGLITRK